MTHDPRESRPGSRLDTESGLDLGSPLGPAALDRLAVDGPDVPHWTNVAELGGVDHRANRLDLPVTDVERQGVEAVAAPVADDRTRLAVHLMRLHDAADPDKRGDERIEHPGHVLRAGDVGAP